MSTKLEQLIRDNREAFDAPEPDPGHFDRFEARLQAAELQRIKRDNRSGMLKVAALILLLISASVFVFDYATREIRQRMMATAGADEFPLEMHEAMFYYNTRTEQQLGKLNKMAANQTEAANIRNSALQEIAKLDRCTGDLKSELQRNPGNEKIQEAILLNQQMKEEVVTNIVTQISQTKN